MTESESPEAGERAHAPGELALIEAFVNTVAIDSGGDQIATRSALADWLRARGLLASDSNASAADLHDALALREAFRALLYANCCGAEVGDASATFADLAARCALALRVDADGVLRLEPLRGGVSGALARLCAIAFAAMAVGNWRRLKACRAEGCRWAFYDSSKNRSGAWCSMAGCGNRAKVRAYQQRRKG